MIFLNNEAVITFLSVSLRHISMMESLFKCLGFIRLVQLTVVELGKLISMGTGTELGSQNARNVILRHQDKLYYVNRVRVNLCEGQPTHKAVFHARRATDNRLENLDLEITRKLYDVLVEYARLDNSGHILILQIDGRNSKWCLISENWFNQRASCNNHHKYII
jgi:hypothetical protein